MAEPNTKRRYIIISNGDLPPLTCPVDQLSHEAKQPMTGSKARKLAAELDEARAALAATPEHLR